MKYFNRGNKKESRFLYIKLRVEENFGFVKLKELSFAKPFFVMIYKKYTHEIQYCLRHYYISKTEQKDSYSPNKD